MVEKGSITDHVASIAVILILVATLGVSAFNILGNASMVTNYSEPIGNMTTPSTIYLKNTEIKTGSVSIFNATFAAVVVTDYNVTESTGVVTIPSNASTRLVNGSAYSLYYLKDSVPSIVKTLALTVIAIIGAISIVIILARFVR